MNGITISVSNGEIRISSVADQKELNMTTEENELALMFVSAFVESGINPDALEIARKSDDYITVVYHGAEWETDVARLKYTSRTKWVAIEVPESKREALINDIRFDAQKNKRQAMWKSKIRGVEDARNLALLAAEGLLEMKERFPNQM